MCITPEMQAAMDHNARLAFQYYGTANPEWDTFDVADTAAPLAGPASSPFLDDTQAQ